MLTVVFMKWFDPKGRYNSLYTYGADHVNRAKRMVDRHLKTPHRFILLTDDATGIDSDIKVKSLPLGLMKLGHRWPKLTLFSPTAKARLGERILYLDLDLVILREITSLIESAGDFKIMKALTTRMPYNSGMILMTAGCRPQVWDKFKMLYAEDLYEENGMDASDQYWIYKALGPNEDVWSPSDGVLNYQAKLYAAGLPENARIVFFPGYSDPSMPSMQARHEWVAKHWR